MDWIIQAQQGNINTYLTEYDRFTLRADKAQRFASESDALKHINWEGAGIGNYHESIRAPSSSWLKNRYADRTFSAVNISIDGGISRHVISKFVSNHVWSDIGGGVYISSNGNHSMVLAT